MGDVEHAEANPAPTWRFPIFVFFYNARKVFKSDKLGREIIGIALPAAMALAADPIASLIDTAFIGQLGSMQIAAVGVAIAIFNQASKVTIFPLVSITTSFVAEEDTVKRMNDQKLKIAAANDLEKGSEKTKPLSPEDGWNLNDHQETEKIKCKTTNDKDDDDDNGDFVASKVKGKSERRSIPLPSPGNMRELTF